MKKICEACKKDFEPLQPHYRFCPACFKPRQDAAKKDPQQKSLPANLLLNSYYDEKGNELKELYIDIPKKLAQLFANDKKPLARKQLYDFHRMITNARRQAILKGIDEARPILWQCSTDVEHQFARDIIPESFLKFMEHHLPMAEKDESSLEGFFHHLDSILKSFPIKRRDMK